MRDHDSETDPPTPLSAGARGAGALPTGDVDNPNQEMQDLLEKWEEHYLKHEDARAETLGIHDSKLLAAIRDQIDDRKALYAFLKLPFEQEREGELPGGERLPGDMGETAGLLHSATPNHPSDRDSNQCDLSHIGRYRVIRLLGQGGFGQVYLAHDAELDRFVAIKVPITERLAQFVNLDSYLNEARIVARLSHPNIVPVYDVGRTDGGRFFVVSRYMEGGDLAVRMNRGRHSFVEVAELVATIAEALHYAHTQDLFHRDIKPANILLDAAGAPSLADFGLALKDENVGKGERFLGTAAYMSPEQARGEGHLVDGRSDIFSLGIVFYELLTGRRPFRGSSRPEVMHKIINHEPRPPRQSDDKIPRELERICMKALWKRASDRYLSADDLAEDLRHFLKLGLEVGQPDLMPPEPINRAAGPFEGPAPPAVSGPSDSSGHPIKIVPKGLGSFDENDADFFLELLPGPRDRAGLPDGLRFWKTRIEATDADKTFRVGIIYGPSGCGKSSLVKAGLLPLLREHVESVYLEASGVDTETTLLRLLHKECPGLPVDADLVQSFAALRRGRHLLTGHKVLVVLDQFEQWLFARGHARATELVAALRQCDGEHVQVLCLVRDDFWMAITRFMRDLEIDLVPDRNVAAIDLFDPKHARKVLAAYGRAYETLPPRVDDLSRDQQTYLDQVISGLAQDSKIVPVRLALFAEMVKAKPWTTATLREVGGMDGVGVKFLDETFASARSSPKHHYHQKAAQAVLKALLPETDADIKGMMRSLAELRIVSGYADQLQDFDDLIRVLDKDLHLITPVDPEGSIDESGSASTAGAHCYQLTHDYLVHSLRDWLTRKQRETRRGRAELLLVERSTQWNAKHEGRYLPSAGEWFQIRTLTRGKGWSESQRRMMARAGLVHGRKLIGLLGLLGLLSTAGLAFYAYTGTERLLSQLSTANIENIPKVVGQLKDYPRWTYSQRLRALANQPGNDTRSKLAYSLALLPEDRSQLNFLYQRLLVADPIETVVLRDSLYPFRGSLSSQLWKELRGAAPQDSRILPVAGALARYNADDQSWNDVGDRVAEAMVLVSPVDVFNWLKILRPSKACLLGPLRQILRKKARPQTDRVHATIYLVDYSKDSPMDLVDLLMDAEPKEFGIILSAVRQRMEQTSSLLQAAIQGDEESASADENEKDQRAERQAKAAVALVHLGGDASVWPLLAHRPDPRLRSFIIHWLKRLDADPGKIVDQIKATDPGLAVSPDARKLLAVPGSRDPNHSTLFDRVTSKRRALILALGCYDPDRLFIDERNREIQELPALDRDDPDADTHGAVERIAPGPEAKRRREIRKLLALYRDDPDAGVHGAAYWTLRRWGQSKELRRIDAELANNSNRGNRRWFVNSLGQTMVIIDGPVDFPMGSPESDPNHQEEEALHTREIPRRIAVSSMELSVSQFEVFLKEYLVAHPDPNMIHGSDPDQPQPAVNWYLATAFCNWLSRRERLTEVYEPIEQHGHAEGMRIRPGALDRDGYRLPVEAEWEYACRSGTVTSRFYGNAPALLREYARLDDPDKPGPVPCGSLMPNDFGLFDMMGNLGEWCHDRQYDYRSLRKESSNSSQMEIVMDTTWRMMRGGTFNARGSVARSACRYSYLPAIVNYSNGLRVVRTLP
jgi:serine/threonine protein kinase/formylglycine-generating enzyme required for sulfatase activity